MQYNYKSFSCRHKLQMNHASWGSLFGNSTSEPKNIYYLPSAVLDSVSCYHTYFSQLLYGESIIVPFVICDVDWTATAGAVPYATDTYGTKGFAVTNLSLRATKDIKVSDSFSVPVFGQLTANPCSQKAYLMFGFTLQP